MGRAFNVRDQTIAATSTYFCPWTQASQPHAAPLSLKLVREGTGRVDAGHWSGRGTSLAPTPIPPSPIQTPGCPDPPSSSPITTILSPTRSTVTGVSSTFHLQSSFYCSPRDRTFLLRPAISSERFPRPDSPRLRTSFQPSTASSSLSGPESPARRNKPLGAQETATIYYSIRGDPHRLPLCASFGSVLSAACSQRRSKIPGQSQSRASQERPDYKTISTYCRRGSTPSWQRGNEVSGSPTISRPIPLHQPY